MANPQKVEQTPFEQIIKEKVVLNNRSDLDDFKALYTIQYLISSFDPDEIKVICSHLVEECKKIKEKVPVHWSTLADNPRYYDSEENINEAKGLGLLPETYVSPDDDMSEDVSVLHDNLDEFERVPVALDESDIDFDTADPKDITAEAEGTMGKQFQFAKPHNPNGIMPNRALNTQGGQGVGIGSLITSVKVVPTHDTDDLLQAVVRGMIRDDLSRPIPVSFQVIGDRMKMMMGGRMVFNVPLLKRCAEGTMQGQQLQLPHDKKTEDMPQRLDPITQTQLLSVSAFYHLNPQTASVYSIHVVNLPTPIRPLGSELIGKMILDHVNAVTDMAGIKFNMSENFVISGVE